MPNSTPFKSVKISFGSSATIGFLLVVTLFVSLAFIFWPTFSTLIGFYGQSESGSHALFVLAGFAIMVFGLRATLNTCPIRPCWWGVIGVGVAMAVWLVGELVFVRLLTDVAWILMFEMAILAVLGKQWFWALRFPLFFLFLLVSFEAPLIPTLIHWTANASVFALNVTGIPVYQEGASIIVPSGAWAVVEACSGIRYLQACVALCTLYAWSFYVTARKRALFIFGAILIGVVGNWVRAYLTILIAHISDNRYLRDDHGTFGWWLFFVFLIFYCWLGWRYRDDNAVVGAGETPDTASSNPIMPAFVTTIIVLAMPLAAAVMAQQMLTSALASSEAAKSRVIAISPAASWLPVENSANQWQPELRNVKQQHLQSFEKNGRRVVVFFGLFEGQSWDSKLVSSSNQFVRDENTTWNVIKHGSAAVSYAGAPLTVTTGVIQGRNQQLLAWRWYWVANSAMGSGAEAKLWQLRERIQGHGDRSVWVALSTPINQFGSDGAGSSAASSRAKAESAETLAEFLRDMSGQLSDSLR